MIDVILSNTKHGVGHLSRHISNKMYLFRLVIWASREKIHHWSGGCVCLVSWQPAAGEPALGYTGDRRNYIPCHTHTHTQKHSTHTNTASCCCHGNNTEKAPLAGKHMTQTHSLTVSLSLPSLPLLLCCLPLNNPTILWRRSPFPIALVQQRNDMRGNAYLQLYTHTLMQACAHTRDLDLKEKGPQVGHLLASSAIVAEPLSSYETL